MKYQALILSVAVLMSGCATQTFVMGDTSNNTPTQETTHSFFVEGIGQEKMVDAASVCGGADKVQKVQTKLTFWNGFLGGITFGIYTPRTAMVYCKS
jgi:hypothetical protein